MAVFGEQPRKSSDLRPKVSFLEQHFIHTYAPSLEDQERHVLAMPNASAEVLKEAVSSSTRRTRELYKYFIPPGSIFSASKANVPNTVLAAHAQLVAWRLNCQRAMVSLIDRDQQYFVAEASKTLHLDDQSAYDEPSDAIWAGCIAVPKAGRLCEHTIQQLPPQDGGPAYFEVLDLTKDPRFNTLPFVTGEPHFKYYCGVPLKTKNGIPIGSLFALDDKARNPIGRTDQQFLATMAENVMTHYENVKEKEDRKRVLNMNMCLAAFVDPENQVKKHRRRRPTSQPGGGSKKPSSSVAGDTGVGAEGLRRKSPQQSHASSHNGDSDSHSAATASSFGNRVEEDDTMETFKRAADLLHASLSLAGGGGIVFMDTATSYRSRNEQQRKSPDRSSDGESEYENPFRRRGSMEAPTFRSTSSWGPPRLADPPELMPVTTRVADVLASTWVPGPTEENHKENTPFIPLAHEELAKLIKRHPRGKLFQLDLDGMTGSSSSSDDVIYDMPRSTKLTPSKSEAFLLSKHFPGARQLIFLPLWDATASRFSTMVAYTTSEFRSFASNPDFLYCIAFSSCIMTEITRLATLAADQQKSDFIGSVSHELRSPLHGILASCEFLTDTVTTTFQRSLIDTADSCARTLLDTINMVLDYSKINAFERNARKVRRKRGEREANFAVPGGPQLNIFGDVDLAGITEEVVEGVATGQVFKDSLTSVDAVDLTDDTSRQGFASRKDVEIILDIAPRASPKDWVFITQPGAFRRIIMNLCGNAIKYTRSGYIRVKLEAHNHWRTGTHDGGEEPHTTVIKVTITDTGQGMSPQFMRTKLYTPFAQENSIAPGTGLGLSLVKSMVTMLNGEINIQSTLGVGTEVTVTFPMTLSASTSSSDNASGSTPTSSGSIERVKDDSLRIVQQKARNRRAILFPDHLNGPVTDATQLVRDVINRYLTGWFGFQVVAPFSTKDLPDLIITDEADLPALINLLPGGLDSAEGPMVVVLCSATSRKAVDKNILSRFSRIEAVSHPFGPYKLAKSIKWCLEKLDRSLVQETEAESQAAEGATEKDRRFDVEDVSLAVEQLTITNPDPNIPDVHVIRSGGALANEDSVHAQLVSGSTDTSNIEEEDSRKEYPFPGKDHGDGTISPSNLDIPEPDRPALSTRKTIAPTAVEIASQHAEEATPMSRKGALTTTVPALASPTKQAPRLLLVDDNKVNLRLLQTYMKKRKYTDVFSAEDGAQAVAIYRDLITQQPPRPPEVVFMDISMPIMNGFQATREIREIEAQYREQFPSPMTTPISALIIALTGLASGRDQSEAFTSGFDLFLTKPTSFREVGRLLDNWEKNGGAASVGVPHGAALSGEGNSGITE